MSVVHRPDPSRVRAGCGQLRLLLSDNDPLTADAASNRRLAYDGGDGVTMLEVPDRKAARETLHHTSTNVPFTP